MALLILLDMLLLLAIRMVERMAEQEANINIIKQQLVKEKL
jgi:hypothetical protein